MSVYRQMVEYRRDERAKRERGLSPRALSSLTRSCEDRRAWDEAYRSAVRIGAARSWDAPQGECFSVHVARMSAVGRFYS